MTQNIEGEELTLLSSNRNRMAVLQIADTGSLPVGSTNIDKSKNIFYRDQWISEEIHNYLKSLSDKK